MTNAGGYAAWLEEIEDWARHNTQLAASLDAEMDEFRVRKRALIRRIERALLSERDEDVQVAALRAVVVRWIEGNPPDLAFLPLLPR